MRIRQPKKVMVVLSALAVLATLFVFSTHHGTVDFNTQVKPIINKKCISCHGGVKRQGGFSLLFRAEALANTESGKPAIIPGDPDGSEMIRRLHLTDPEERMPYKQEPLSKEEIEIFRKWIKQGAQWGDHWAYVPVEKVNVPKESSSFFGWLPAKKLDWVKNGIDHFILQKLEEQRLKPAAEADKATLLRRVSLDLTGLPPSSSLAQQFLKSHDAKAYEVLVDSLLASPHFGERWATLWMDLARYADTKGYERDDRRDIWRYRDWLIKAFNADKPYDQFLAEQLAGDLMPNATDDQLIATAFHRNTMTNDEGGTDNEEFRTAAVMDRVNSTWEGILSTTFSCVQCHSHPYDPFTHDEYYKFMAFFNNTRDEDTFGDYPVLRHFEAGDSAKLAQLVNWLTQNGYKKEAHETYRFLKTWQPAINSIQTDQFVNAELSDTKWLALRNKASARLKHVNLEGKNQLIFRYMAFAPGGVWTIHLDAPQGPVWKTIPIAPTQGWSWTIVKVDLPVGSGVHDLYFSYQNPNLKKPEATGMQFDWFAFTQALPGKDKPGHGATEALFWELLTKDVPATPVMMDNPKDMFRPTQVFEKGSWLAKGKEVQADVPHSLNPLPKGAPRNRLGLAMWLTDKKNPLTARTMVNRLWEQLFGAGLVETLEDMGTQGATPTHKELLDYLSYRFMNDHGWSIKKMLKEMVLSATYRQDARVSPVLLEKDPYNKFYARGARVRLSAEQVRDQALAVSGLLNAKMYGPSVMPWQPEGIWMSPWNGEDWRTAEDSEQYRRAVYTFWKRTAPYPSMITFDGVGREVCAPRRIRTNTPLQALVTLNDSVYLEASRHLAFRMQNETATKGNVQEQIKKGYELALFKPIAPAKLQALEKLYQTALQQYKKNAEAAFDMVGKKESYAQPETAALVVVANALLNLDELVMKN